MNDLYYENQGLYKYLVYEVRDSDVLDTTSLGMLTNNKINSLVPTTFTQMDEKRFIKFNISSKVPVAEIFDSAVSKKHLLGTFTAIVDAVIDSENYMLDINSLMLDREYMFTDAHTGETQLICMPLIDDYSHMPELGDFFRDIMHSIQFDQTENCDHVASIMNYLNAETPFALDDFRSLLYELVAQNETTQILAEHENSSEQMVDTVADMTLEAREAGMHAMENKEDGFLEDEFDDIEDQANEPQMSLLYLMQHYNKENAAIYKSQKEERKRRAKAKKVATKSKTPSEKDMSSAQSTNGFGFAIPRWGETKKEEEL